MVPVVIREWHKMNDDCRALYISFVEGKQFDLYNAAEIFNRHRNLFDEQFLVKNVIGFKDNCRYTPYIDAVAYARTKACDDMQRLFSFRKAPIEFFENYNYQEYGDEANDIMLEYQYSKKLAYALLH